MLNDGKKEKIKQQKRNHGRVEMQNKTKTKKHERNRNQFFCLLYQKNIPNM